MVSNYDRNVTPCDTHVDDEQIDNSPFDAAECRWLARHGSWWINLVFPVDWVGTPTCSRHTPTHIFIWPTNKIRGWPQILDQPRSTWRMSLNSLIRPIKYVRQRQSLSSSDILQEVDPRRHRRWRTGAVRMLFIIPRAYDSYRRSVLLCRMSHAEHASLWFHVCVWPGGILTWNIRYLQTTPHLTVRAKILRDKEIPLSHNFENWV